MSNETLADLRAALDTIDQELVERIGCRLELCRRVAEHKKRYGIPMMQPDRVHAVKVRVAALAEYHDVRPEFMIDLYERIIEEACRLEDKLIGGNA